tara:strand:- start:654 stop:878 length:225 start_codon:yes stop_codon:yes gene_type:complete
MFTLYRLLTNISKGCYVKSKPMVKSKPVVKSKPAVKSKPVKSTKVFHNTVLGVPFNYIRKKKIPRNEQYETKDF